MTFTTKVKDELSKIELDPIENRNLLIGFIKINGIFNNNKLNIMLENPSVARKLFKTLKYCYNKVAKITLRIQKKFKLKTIYILEVDDTDRCLKSEIENFNFNDEETKKSYIKGIFLASGNISNPQKTYHLDLSFNNLEIAKLTQDILNDLNYNFKLLKREKKYILYLKSSEEISDFLKLLGTNQALFFYEDIRIYRDHKNMVNRLNNCEQANIEKLLKASDEQLKKIKYIKENDYYSLLDEKTQEVCELRLKYTEESFQTLAEILSSETQKKVTKSYINHHFRKINNIYEKIIEESVNDK